MPTQELDDGLCRETELRDQPQVGLRRLRVFHFPRQRRVERELLDARMAFGVSGNAEPTESMPQELARFQNRRRIRERPSRRATVAGNQQETVRASAGERTQPVVEVGRAGNAARRQMRNRRQAGHAQPFASDRGFPPLALRQAG